MYVILEFMTPINLCIDIVCINSFSAILFPHSPYIWNTTISIIERAIELVFPGSVTLLCTEIWSDHEQDLKSHPLR
jgi:hypothetical protein